MITTSALLPVGVPSVLVREARPEMTLFTVSKLMFEVMVVAWMDGP